MSKVRYEWDIETLSIGDDCHNVEDHEHRDSLSEFGADDLREALAKPDQAATRDARLVLVRDLGRSRSWAYVEDGKLSTHFEDSSGAVVSTVLKRFHKELRLHKELLFPATPQPLTEPERNEVTLYAEHLQYLADSFKLGVGQLDSAHPIEQQQLLKLARHTNNLHGKLNEEFRAENLAAGLQCYEPEDLDQPWLNADGSQVANKPCPGQLCDGDCDDVSCDADK